MHILVFYLPTLFASNFVHFFLWYLVMELPTFCGFSVFFVSELELGVILHDYVHNVMRTFECNK